MIQQQNLYEKRIVCFIDILGFSSRIKDTTKNGQDGIDSLQTVCIGLELIRSLGEVVGHRAKIEGAVSTQFSDSIVISFPWNDGDNSILVAFATIKYMQIYLIKYCKFLLRGGIVMGDVIHNDKMIVGPAMIAAHELESKCAVSPRIVIDPKVAYRYNSILKKHKKEWKGGSVIQRDYDDTYFIDYFNISEEELPMTLDEVKEYFRTLCTLVSDNIERADMNIRIKYLWMRSKIKKSKLFQQPAFARIYKELVTDKRK